MKAFRLLMILSLFLLFPPSESKARQAYCETALARCVKGCEAFPGIFRDGCVIGCGIGYLSCGD